MSDIVKRLRHRYHDRRSVAWEAADEIERLQAKNEEQRGPMSDVLERIRNRPGALGMCYENESCYLLDEAADEIERLTAKNEELQRYNVGLADENVRLNSIMTVNRAAIDPLRADFARLQEHKRKQMEDIMTLGQRVGSLEQEIERLRAYSAHERSLGAEEAMQRVVELETENARLRAKLQFQLPVGGERWSF